MNVRFGRYVFGAASLLLGIACVVLHDQLVSNWQWPGDIAFIDVSAAALAAGGVAVAIPGTERIGAVVLAAVYRIFALTFVPDAFAQPGLYASWGNIFYQLAPAAGALAAYCIASPRRPRSKTTRKAAVIVFGLSNGSFAIEQVEFLARTASLVPKWVPPGGKFWAIATTIFLGLAAVSMVSGYRALLASRLTALMFGVFGVAIWVPLLIADPKSHSNWSEGLETFVIAGAAWIVAELLSRSAPSASTRHASAASARASAVRSRASSADR